MRVEYKRVYACAAVNRVVTLKEMGFVVLVRSL